MLLLFDIDGTLLLRAADAHRDAIYEALRVVHGVTEPERRGMEVAGRTDADIARTLLVHAGVTARADRRARRRRAGRRLRGLRRACAPPTCSAHVAPGMPELLERLAAREDTLLALVTGNYEPIARLKLRRRRHRALLRHRPGRLRLRSRGPLDAAGDRAPPRRRRAATASRGRRRAPRSSATRRATSPARAPTACASRRSRPGRTSRPSCARPTPSRATPTSSGRCWSAGWRRELG